MNYKFRSLPNLFLHSAKQFPDNHMMWEKPEDKYVGITYRQASERIMRFAGGLCQLGIKKADRVALISEGRNDWVIGELAIMFCGAISVPLSVKINEPEDLKFRLSHSGCKAIIISGNHKQKAFELMDQLDELEYIILLDESQETYPKSEKNVKVTSLEDLFEKGEDWLKHNRASLHEIIRSINLDDYANICYTSGTTADPKGIILTHRNYLHNVEQASAIFEVPAYYTSLHILPWDHSFAHTVGIYALIRNGASLASVKAGKTLNETLRNIPICIKEIRPHFLLSVPALAKNFRNNIENGVKEKGAIANGLFKAGLKIAYAHNGKGYNRGRGLRSLLKPLYWIFDVILFKKIRKNFGGRLKFFVGGGALLDIDLQKFFYALRIPMYQGYGLTEASPVISSNTPDNHKLGSSGKIVPWLNLKICDDDGNAVPEGQQGEIVVKGGNVMAGYWENPKATAETIRDGWLYTGDLGYLDQDGYLYVMGRTKSLLIASDGEKYSPEAIEEAIVEKSPFINQIMLYNNQSPYTVALLVVNKPKVNEWMQKQKLDKTNKEHVGAAIEKIESELKKFAPKGEYDDLFPERWLPAATALLDEPFTEQNRLLNSTMKIVRPMITEKYQKTIEFLFTPEGKNITCDRNIESLMSFLSDNGSNNKA